jgi:cystathionine gamma-lyase/homocysteine desulfhydrase
MTHASVPTERRAELGLTEGMVRVSVGIENVEDLLADLDQALAAV